MEEKDPITFVRDTAETLLGDFKRDTNDDNILKEISPLVLAYIGDCVYELFVRTFLVFDKRRKVNEIHDEAVKLVNSGAQAAIIHAIEPQLSEREREVVIKGRNTKSNLPKNTSPMEYRYSTGFEALIGYHYLMGEHDRLNEIFHIILNELDSIEGDIFK
ncbi:MAG TPA: Mini-ribonuclease 3 [Thermoanaerobacterales bacterium]|nr:Mini-ribonuclease 3 [Thermoanaerobacterales bacterium]